MKTLYIIAFVFICQVFSAQQSPKRITTGTATVGLSAISVNTLVAKTYSFLYPFYNYGTDSAASLFFFSTRQKADGGNLYLNKGFIGALNMAADSVQWLFESNYYELGLWGNDLFLSNEAKTARYNKLHGFEDFKYPARLIYTLPAANKGFLYTTAGSNELSCINLETGAAYWSAVVPGNENWVDVKPVRDSLLLVAAGGLYALHPANGLLWSYPLATATKITRPLTYSLANNNPAIRKIGTVVKTSTDENSVTELSSNILEGEGVFYFASKEKTIAVNAEGKLLWELDMKDYPVSKMLLYKKGASLFLINFGLARYGDNYVSYGSPFVLNIDAENGKIKNYSSLSGIENLVDFTITDKSLVFAGKNAVLEVKEGRDEVETLLKLDVPKYGGFAEFIDGARYYTEKEGFYVALNFINDNLIYFKADNNKIYSIDKGSLNYEYHFTDIYRLEKKFDNKLLLASENKTILISSNFDLLFTFDVADKPVVAGNHIYFVGEQQLRSVDLKALK